MAWPLLVLLVFGLAPTRELNFVEGLLSRQSSRDAANIEEISKITTRLRLGEAAVTSLQDQLARARTAHAECDSVLTSLPDCDVEAARRQCEDQVNATEAKGKASLSALNKQCEDSLRDLNNNVTANLVLHETTVQRQRNANTTLLRNQSATLEATNKSLQEKLDKLTNSSKARTSALRAEIKALKGLVETLTTIAAKCAFTTEGTPESTTEEDLQTTEEATTLATMTTEEATTLASTTTTTTENSVLQCQGFLNPSGIVNPGPNERSIRIGRTQFIVGNDNGYGAMVSWKEARDICKSKGMLMLRLRTDFQERKLLKSHFPKLGLSAARQYQYWQGSDRRLVEDKYWSKKLWECEPDDPKPSELCQVSELFSKPAGTVLQHSCQHKHNYICEKLIA